MNFLNPALLWGLTAVAAPIVIFLMFRRKYKRVEWAAMEFLLRAQRRTNKRLKIENLLLLILRCLVLALLALALARPKVVTFAGSLLPSGSSTHHVLIIDASYSMAYKIEAIQNETFMARALKEASALIDRIDNEDEISVIRMDDTPEVVVERNIGKDDFLTAKMNELTATHEGADFAEALRQTQELIANSNKPNQMIHVVTDFQLRNFQQAAEVKPAEGAAAPEQKGNLEMLTRELSDNPQVTVNIIDVGDDVAGNRQIRRLQSAELKTLAGVEAAFTAELFNYSSSAEQNYEVIFKVDGEEKDRKLIDDLPPREAREIAFSHLFAEPGFHTVTVETADASRDALPVDDARYFAVEVLPGIRVLAVNGEVGSAWNGETDFLRAAFPAEEGIDRRGPIQATVMLDGDLTADSFADHDVILMCNVGSLDEDVWKALESAVREQGKAVVWFMGDQVDVEHYNAKIYNNRAGLLPARLKGRAGYPDHKRYVWMTPDKSDDFSHPILRSFNDFKGFIFSAYVYEFMAIEDDWTTDDTTRLVLRYGSENDAVTDPAMLVKTCGEGKSVLVTTTADREWTNLPTQAVYLPLLSEMIAYLAYRNRSDINLAVNGKILREYSLDYSSAPMIFTPRLGDVKIDATMNKAQNARYVVYPNTDTAGVYTLFAARNADAGANDLDDGDLSVHFAVNLDPAEGNLERATEQLLRTVFPAFKFHYRRYNPQSAAEIREEESGKVRELWKYFAYAVLALLFLESFLAQRFGQYQRLTPPAGRQA